MVSLFDAAALSLVLLRHESMDSYQKSSSLLHLHQALIFTVHVYLYKLVIVSDETSSDDGGRRTLAQGADGSKELSMKLKHARHSALRSLTSC